MNPGYDGHGSVTTGPSSVTDDEISRISSYDTAGDTRDTKSVSVAPSDEEYGVMPSRQTDCNTDINGNSTRNRTTVIPQRIRDLVTRLRLPKRPCCNNIIIKYPHWKRALLAIVSLFFVAMVIVIVVVYLVENSGKSPYYA